MSQNPSNLDGSTRHKHSLTPMSQQPQLKGAMVGKIILKLLVLRFAKSTIWEQAVWCSWNSNLWPAKLQFDAQHREVDMMRASWIIYSTSQSLFLDVNILRRSVRRFLWFASLAAFCPSFLLCQHRLRYKFWVEVTGTSCCSLALFCPSWLTPINSKQWLTVTHVDDSASFPVRHSDRLKKFLT